MLLLGLIAINLALAARKPSGPDLGVRASESGLEAGPDRDARLWYMQNLLGRWDADGRCSEKAAQWAFLRRQIISPDAVCDIRRFVPGSPLEIELYRCERRGEHEGVQANDKASDWPATQRYQIGYSDTGHLTVSGDIEANLKTCRIPL